MPRPGEDRSDVGGASQFNNIGPVPLPLPRGKHWEVLLVSAQELIVSVHVDDFESAAESLLRWLRGDEGAEIVENVRDHLFSSAVTPSGFVLHSQKAYASGPDGTIHVSRVPDLG